MTKKLPTNTSFNFSEALLELEAITLELENGDIKLDKAVDRFQRGSKLAKELKVYLETTENTIQTIKSDLHK